MFKAVFLDFYGTVVREDEVIIDSICRKIKAAANSNDSLTEIGARWWKHFSKGFLDEYGEHFRSQRELEIYSLQATLEYYGVKMNPAELGEPLLSYWKKPDLYEDARLFLQTVRQPVCIVSNIDRNDLHAAVQYHELSFADMITSEDARAYKPRPEMFEMAMKRMKVQPNEVIHVGDSLQSDVAGAQQLGIKVAWVNRHERKKSNDMEPDYTITKLTELLDIL